MKNIQRKSLLLALAITLTLTGLLFYFLRVNSLNAGPLVNVVVATAEIEANTTISEKQVKVVRIPQKFVMSSFAGSVQEVTGKITLEKIYNGEFIIKSKLTQSIKHEGLSAELPAGYRAVTLKVDRVSGVDQKIQTGDWVDVLVYLRPPQIEREEIRTIFQQVEVLNVDTGKEAAETYVTLCLNPEDTEKLVLADSVGTIRLVLRRYDDERQPYLPGIKVEDF